MSCKPFKLYLSQLSFS